AGDTFFTYKLKGMYDFFKENNTDCICATEIDNINDLKRMAVAVVNKDNIVTELQEKPQNPKSNLGVYATYIYKKETVKLFEKYINEKNNPDAPGHFVEWLYKHKDVKAYKFDGECYDIGTKESYNYVCDMMEVCL
ncbi:MAG: sugar phosphate nucleotidyltransferase, partial [Oscillospiraceae bacterium]